MSHVPPTTNVAFHTLFPKGSFRLVRKTKMLRNFVACVCTYKEDERWTGVAFATESGERIPCSVPIRSRESSTYRTGWADAITSLLARSSLDTEGRTPRVLVISPKPMWDLASLRSEVFLHLPLREVLTRVQSFSCDLEHIDPSSLPGAHSLVSCLQEVQAGQTDAELALYLKSIDLLLLLSPHMGRMRPSSRRVASALLDQNPRAACTKDGIPMDHPVWDHVEVLWRVLASCAAGEGCLRRIPGTFDDLWKAVPTVVWREEWPEEDILAWVQLSRHKGKEPLPKTFRTLASLIKCALSSSHEPETLETLCCKPE